MVSQIAITFQAATEGSCIFVLLIYQAHDCGVFGSDPQVHRSRLIGVLRLDSDWMIGESFSWMTLPAIPGQGLHLPLTPNTTNQLFVPFTDDPYFCMPDRPTFLWKSLRNTLYCVPFLPLLRPRLSPNSHLRPSLNISRDGSACDILGQN